MSDSQDELLTRRSEKKATNAFAGKVSATQRRQTIADNANIPILDRIVRPSKQKDLADLLIKIIQTNEAEDKKSLQNYGADVSSATLRDIDAKLSAVLESKEATSPEDEVQRINANQIPMLTEIAEFPVSSTPVMEFPISLSENPESEKEASAPIDFPIFEFPATSKVGQEIAAANSQQAPQSANQDNITPVPMFSLVDDELKSELALAPRERIEALVEEHTAQVKAQLELQIEEMKKKLLAELLEPQDR
ncbi:MAG: hypothetical protein AB8B86_07485 [Pseudomonadales bacterium]